jgi:hypothetical protein
LSPKWGKDEEDHSQLHLLLLHSHRHHQIIFFFFSFFIILIITIFFFFIIRIIYFFLIILIIIFFFILIIIFFFFIIILILSFPIYGPNCNSTGKYNKPVVVRVMAPPQHSVMTFADGNRAPCSSALIFNINLHKYYSNFIPQCALLAVVVEFDWMVVDCLCPAVDNTFCFTYKKF